MKMSDMIVVPTATILVLLRLVTKTYEDVVTPSSTLFIQHCSKMSRVVNINRLAQVTDGLIQAASRYDSKGRNCFTLGVKT